MIQSRYLVCLRLNIVLQVAHGSFRNVDGFYKLGGAIQNEFHGIERGLQGPGYSFNPPFLVPAHNLGAVIDLKAGRYLARRRLDLNAWFSGGEIGDISLTSESRAAPSPPPNPVSGSSDSVVTRGRSSGSQRCLDLAGLDQSQAYKRLNGIPHGVA